MLNSVYKPSLAIVGPLTGTSGASATDRFEWPLKLGHLPLPPPAFSENGVAAICAPLR